MCAKCGSEDRDDDWAELTVILAPGRRGPRRWSAVATMVTGFEVCPACVASPWGAAVKDLLEDPWQVGLRPANLTGHCRIQCAHPRRRHRITIGIRGYRCPGCGARAHIEDLEERPNWWHRLGGRLNDRLNPVNTLTE
jgi:hypothetical protein